MSAPLRVTASPIELLGLSRAGGIVLLFVFVVTQVALAVTDHGTFVLSWSTASALILVIGAAVISMLPGPSQLSALSTWAIIAAVAISTILVTWHLPSLNAAHGYASWHLGANTFVLLALALRRRIGWAWAGMGVMTALTIAWTMTTGNGFVQGVDLIDRQWGTLVVGTLFAVLLRQTELRIREVTDAENKRIIEDEVQRVAADERAIHLTRLERIAGPTLRSIAAHSPVDEGARSQFRVLEAALRDRIRAKAFVGEPLDASARRARRRGVNVILLDDTNDDEISFGGAMELVVWTSVQLDRVAEGTFTARLRATENGFIATIVTSDGRLQLNRRFDETPPEG